MREDVRTMHISEWTREVLRGGYILGNRVYYCNTKYLYALAYIEMEKRLEFGKGMFVEYELPMPVGKSGYIDELLQAEPVPDMDFCLYRDGGILSLDYVQKEDIICVRGRYFLRQIIKDTDVYINYKKYEIVDGYNIVPIYIVKEGE